MNDKENAFGLPLRRIIGSTLLTFLLLSLFLIPERIAMGAGEDAWAAMISESIPNIISSINFTNIASWRQTIANYSRFVGTEGYYSATEFIYNKFREFVPDAHLDPFDIVVPINHGANITIEGKTLRLYPMLPNWVAPSTTLGESGKLVYVGRGEIEELNGKEINGSIVVMDFNCGYNWLVVAAFGARAIIFLEPNDTSYSESMMKRINSPVKILRFYICGDDAKQLRDIIKWNEGIEGKIVSSQVWEKRTAYNIVGLIEGKSKKEEVIAFFTYYDSYSIVPDLAYDKDAAGNPAAWLEIARYFSLNRPERSILFVALSGHYQGMRGMADFLDRYAFGNSTYGQQFAKKIKIAWAIDLSTESPAALVTHGQIQGYSSGDLLDVFPTFGYALYKEGIFKKNDELLFKRGVEIKWNESWALKTLNVKLGSSSLLVLMNEAMRDRVSRDPPYLIGNGVDRVGEYGTGFKTALVPIGTSRLETSMFMDSTGIIGFTLQSALSRRDKWNTPLTSDTFNLENLKPNIEFITCVLHVYANEVGIRVYTSDEEIRGIFARSSVSDRLFRDGFEDRYGMGFPKLAGRVMVYEESLGNWKPIGNALVVINGGEVRERGYFSDSIIIETDEKGYFEVKGLRGSTGGFEIWYEYLVSAFIVNSTSGDIIYAPDSGLYGQEAGPLFSGVIRLDQPEKFTNQVVFKCGSLVFFELVNPYTMKMIADMAVNEAPTHVSTQHFGLPTQYVRRVSGTSELSLLPECTAPIYYPFPVFVPPDIPVEVVAYVEAKPVGVANNAGKGYVLKPGESKFLVAPEAFSSCLFDLSSERLNTLGSYYVQSGGRRVEMENDIVRNYVELMEKGLRDRNYDDYMLYSQRAWYRGLMNYESSKGMFIDTVGTATVLIFLLLVSSFFLERIIFQEASSLKRFVVIALISVIFLFALSYLHPGFAIASNPYILLIGLLSIILFIPALIMLQSQLSRELRAERERRMGIHETSIDKLSATIISISYGINNMRRRGFRTALTLTSLVLFLFSLILLTTFHSYVSESMYEKSVEMRPAFNGLMFEASLLDIRSSTEAIASWRLTTSSLRYISLSLRKELGNVSLYPRVVNNFRFLPYTGEIKYIGTSVSMFVNGELRFNYSFPIKSILGLSAEEPKLGLWDASKYIDPPGAWFSSDDSFECIITEHIARSYGVKLGDYISFSTPYSFKVIGILNSTRLKTDNPKEINGQSIAPPDVSTVDITYTLDRLKSEGFPRTFDSFVLLPWKTLLNTYGGIIRHIVVPVAELNENIKTYSKLISLESNTQVTASDRAESKVYVFSKELTVRSSGFDVIIVSLAIILLILSSTIYGNLYERRRDVYVISVSGASPLSIIFLFLGESLVYSSLGSFIGYFLAMLVLRVLAVLNPGVLGGIATNYSSGYVEIAIALSFAVTVLASLMPIMKIIAIATPSLERKWKRTEPKDDVWEVPLPINVRREDVYGLIAYIWEFMSTHSGDVLSLFNIMDKHFLTVEEGGVHKVKAIYLLNMLPPERGLSQDLEITYAWNPVRRMYSTTVVLKKKSGERRDWIERSTRLLDYLRKQHLMWRGLEESVKREYIQRGMSLGVKSND